MNSVQIKRIANQILLCSGDDLIYLMAELSESRLEVLIILETCIKVAIKNKLSKRESENVKS